MSARLRLGPVGVADDASRQSDIGSIAVDARTGVRTCARWLCVSAHPNGVPDARTLTSARICRNAGVAGVGDNVAIGGVTANPS